MQAPHLQQTTGPVSKTVNPEAPDCPIAIRTLGFNRPLAQKPLTPKTLKPKTTKKTILGWRMRATADQGRQKVEDADAGDLAIHHQLGS